LGVGLGLTMLARAEINPDRWDLDKVH
jgi:hypothetical protein